MRSLLFFTVCIVILFTFLRLYQINTSFLFFNDPGRDLSVLQTWRQSGIPPLLGPQTSALPFNQSAVYFYMLYPFYLIMNHSVFSTFIANWAIHIAVFLVGVFLLRKDKRLVISWLITWFLISIHPQFIIQHRFVWNPSFVGLCIVAAFFFFIYYLDQKTSAMDSRLTVKQLWIGHRHLLGFTLSLALATAFSYSTLPVLIAATVLALWLLRGRRLALIIALLGSIAVVNVPTVFFELRHGFVLTKMILYSEKVPQIDTRLVDKLLSVERYVFAGGRSGMIVLGLLFVILIGLELYQKRSSLKRQSPLIIALLLFLLTLIITFTMPISLQAHYVFGILISGFLVIAFLRWQLAALFCVIASFVWLQPQQVQAYFQPAFRTVSETTQCAQKVCGAIKDPLFVSVQAGFHPYHNGYEFRFLLGEAGCIVKKVETEPKSAQYMAVFSDDSEYQHGKTAYNELTQFGSSQELSQIECTDKLKVHILKKQEPGE